MIDVRVTLVQFSGKPFGVLLFEDLLARADGTGDRGFPMDYVRFHSIVIRDGTVCSEYLFVLQPRLPRFFLFKGLSLNSPQIAPVL